MAYTGTKIKDYRLGYRLHVPKLTSNQGYFDILLPASTRTYVITGLDEYTLYDIRLNANDESSGNLQSYVETRRTSAERMHQFCNISDFIFPQLHMRYSCFKFVQLYSCSNTRPIKRVAKELIELFIYPFYYLSIPKRLLATYLYLKLI